VRCLAEYRPDHRATAAARPDTAARPAVQPAGYGPRDLWSAYGLPGTRPGRARTVAVVTAFDNPNVEADLAAYRTQYGLPACTTANGCFRKVGQDGTATLPQPDQSWGLEAAVDVTMVSAACPRCHVLLVEANDDSYPSMGAAVDTAVRLGAAVVSNSYGAAESNLAMDYASHYQHRDAVVVASTGDGGFGPANFPAVLGNVVAVGGTTLTPADNRRGWTEQAWSGSAGGCSAYVAKPSWQRDHNCPMRTVADVAAVADPQTGVAVYDTFLPPDRAGWQVVGGTSVAAPLVAGTFGLAPRPAGPGASVLYQPWSRHFVNDVVGGSTGFCGGDYLCTGLPGYDAPTGVGTPNGTNGL
jgi:subtilase family serine protease